MSEKTTQELKLNISYKPETAKGEFANLAMLFRSGDECRLDFFYVDKAMQDDDGAQNAYLVSRVSLPPSQLMAIHNMIGENLGIGEGE